MTSTKLQEGTFIPKLKSDSLPEKAIIVEEEILIDNSNLSWEFKKLENITFESKLIISSVNIKSGLVFIKCTFKKGVEFQDIYTDFMISHNNPFNYSILFNNCKGDYIKIYESPNISRGLLFEDECLFDKVSIIKSSLSEIKIRNSRINKLLDLSNVKADELRLDENHLKKHLRIESFKGDISLISNVFDDWAKFWNIDINNSLALNKNKFNGEFEIEASRIEGFFIHENTFNKQFLLENRDTSGANHEAYCNEIYITKAKFLEGADFNGLSKKN